MINSATEFLAKLDHLIFNKTDGDKSISNELWEVRLSNNFLNGTYEKFRVQVVIHVLYKGHIAKTWGSDSNEMNDQIVEWFIIKYSKVFGLEYEIEKNDRKIGSNLFDAL